MFLGSVSLCFLFPSYWVLSDLFVVVLYLDLELWKCSINCEYISFKKIRIGKNKYIVCLFKKNKVKITARLCIKKENCFFTSVGTLEIPFPKTDQHKKKLLKSNQLSKTINFTKYLLSTPNSIYNFVIVWKYFNIFKNVILNDMSNIYFNFI